MDFAFTEEEIAVRDTARRIAADRLAPLAERLPALTDAVNVSAELARAAKASSAAVTSGEPQ